MEERLQKILARGGIASRRAAEQLVTGGRVRVNGRIVTELGAKADPRNDRIEVDGKRVVAEPFVYIVLHKPRGVVATMSDPEGRPTVKEILGASVGGRVYPVGRLDFATSGVLLCTNDGGFADGLLHPKRAVPKTYVVKVKGKMEEADLALWEKGVRLDDGITLPANVHFLRHEADKTWFELTIREGRNQQIRRMGEASGFPVMRLARVGFAEVTAEGLRPGEWRTLTRDELSALKKEYGVPKSIPSGEAQFGGSVKPRRAFANVRDDGGDAPRERDGGTAFSSARSPHAPPRGPSGKRTDKAGPRETAFSRRGRGASPSSSASSERAGSSGGGTTSGPRYGGGAPGRRSTEVTEDWGGGANRGRTDRDAQASRPPSRGGGGGGHGTSDAGGRSSRGRAQDDRPRGDVGGGRSGKTRTTGSSGGAGARDGGDASYRVKTRRG